MALVLAAKRTGLPAQQVQIRAPSWRNVRLLHISGYVRRPASRPALDGPDGPQTLVPELQPKVKQHDADR